MVPVVLDDLPLALKARAEGATKVAVVREVIPGVRVDDDGARTIVLTFVLADPPEGLETWPVEDLWELRRVAREIVPEKVAEAVAVVAREQGVTVDQLPPFSWGVEFKPETMPSLAADDESIDF